MNATTNEELFNKSFVNGLKTKLDNVEKGREADIKAIYEHLGNVRTQSGAVAELTKRTEYSRKTMDYYTIGALVWVSADESNRDVSPREWRTSITKGVKSLKVKGFEQLFEKWTFENLYGDRKLSDFKRILDTLVSDSEEDSQEESDKKSEFDIFVENLQAGRHDERLEELAEVLAAHMASLGLELINA